MQDDTSAPQNDVSATDDTSVDAYYGESEASSDEVDLSFLDEDEK